MPQSLSKILIHLIFSTKNREPLITADMRPELHAYLGKVLMECDSHPLKMNSVEDHVHILCALSKNLAVSKLVEELKTGSSRWMKTKGEAFRSFYWQNGYGVFSVSQSNVENVSNYIANQEAHHRATSFQEEYRMFLKRYAVDFDERYVWD